MALTNIIDTLNFFDSVFELFVDIIDKLKPQLTDDNFRLLSMEQINTPMVCVLCIYGIAIIIFLVEFIIFNWCNNCDNDDNHDRKQDPIFTCWLIFWNKELYQILFFSLYRLLWSEAPPVMRAEVNKKRVKKSKIGYHRSKSSFFWNNFFFEFRVWFLQIWIIYDSQGFFDNLTSVSFLLFSYKCFRINNIFCSIWFIRHWNIRKWKIKRVFVLQ